VNLLPTTLEIHDAIITAKALLFNEKSDYGNVILITKDEEITRSKIVKTIW
jgi:hypothetical protein